MNEDLGSLTSLVWHKRTVGDAIDLGIDIDEVFDTYTLVTELMGSGRFMTTGYVLFMESKWAEVYRRVIGVDYQIEKYKLTEVNDEHR